jgi:hypothetical protein
VLDAGTLLVWTKVDLTVQDVGFVRSKRLPQGNRRAAVLALAAPIPGNPRSRRYPAPESPLEEMDLPDPSNVPPVIVLAPDRTLKMLGRHHERNAR